MQTLLQGLVLFAQDAAEAAAEAAPAADGAAPAGGGFSSLLFPIALTILVFYFLVIVPERKRDKKKRELLEALKKNDRVLTIGGIYGIVSNVKPGEDEIVLKIDEDKDVKMRVTKSSIAQVFSAKEE